MVYNCLNLLIFLTLWQCEVGIVGLDTFLIVDSFFLFIHIFNKYVCFMKYMQEW